jgi:inosine-uridine nucleoside N-ribohydrolase
VIYLNNNKKNILIFSDPGLDDALAIVWLLNQKNLNIIGAVPVAGNHSVDQVTKNMLKIFKNTKNENIPVYYSGSIIQKHHELPNIHGNDAIGDFISNGNFDKDKFKNFEDLIKDINNIAYEIVTLAPCIVLAKFIKETKTPPIKITFMGGLRNVESNFKGTEFNIGIDENAAYEVFKNSTCPVNLIPLDLTRQFYLSENISKIDSDDNNNLIFFKNLCKKYSDLATKRGKNAFPHDLTAVISILYGDLFNWDNGIIELDGFKIKLKTGTKDKVATKINVSSKEFEIKILEGLNVL